MLNTFVKVLESNNINTAGTIERNIINNKNNNIFVIETKLIEFSLIIHVKKRKWEKREKVSLFDLKSPSSSSINLYMCIWIWNINKSFNSSDTTPVFNSQKKVIKCRWSNLDLIDFNDTHMKILVCSSNQVNFFCLLFSNYNTAIIIYLSPL